MRFRVWKFKISYKLEVCLDCTLSHHIGIPLWGGLFKENPIVLNSCLGASSEAFFTIFNSGYTLQYQRGCCLCLVAGLVPQSGHWLIDKLQGSLYLESYLRRCVLKFLIAKDWIKTSNHTYLKVYRRSYYTLLQYICGWPCPAICLNRLVVLYWIHDHMDPSVYTGLGRMPMTPQQHGGDTETHGALQVSGMVMSP